MRGMRRRYEREAKGEICNLGNRKVATPMRAKTDQNNEDSIPKVTS